MAEATTTRPTARKRTASKAPAKAPAKTTTAPKPQAETEEVELAKFPFTMDTQEPTKTYAVFTPPASSGCVGKLYVPQGTVEVKVLLIGPAN